MVWLKEVYSVLCGDLNRGKSTEEGAYVNTQLIHSAVQQKLAQHCKATKINF